MRTLSFLALMLVVGTACDDSLPTTDASYTSNTVPSRFKLYTYVTDGMYSNITVIEDTLTSRCQAIYAGEVNLGTVPCDATFEPLR
jgi:hypothetical protein